MAKTDYTNPCATTVPTAPAARKPKRAVHTLLRWAGDDPAREGLADTPGPRREGLRGLVLAAMTRTRKPISRAPSRKSKAMTTWWCCKDIRFESHCEHHLAPIIGRAHVGYLPTNKVVGISKLARVVEAFARRLQVQEKMNAQIAHCIQKVLEPKGVAVVIEAAHQCMTTRGVHKTGVTMVTSTMLGAFRENDVTRREFLNIIGNPASAAKIAKRACRGARSGQDADRASTPPAAAPIWR